MINVITVFMKTYAVNHLEMRWIGVLMCVIPVLLIQYVITVCLVADWCIAW